MPNDDTVEKGGWGGENVSKSDDVILGCSLICYLWESTVQNTIPEFSYSKSLIVASAGGNPWRPDEAHT